MAIERPTPSWSSDWRAAAVARFGAERARALDEMIRLTASHLVAVDAYRLEADEPPAFLLDAATPPVAS
jgi:hypothetical protein